MDEQHKQHAEFIFTHMSLTLTEYGKIYPTYIMIVEGQLIPVMVTPRAEMSAEEYENVVHQAAQQMQPDALMFICEQWMISREKDDPEIQLLIDGVIRPSDQSDKEEYLTLIYKHRDGTNESLIGKIYSDPAGTRYTKDQSWIDNCVSNMIREWT